MKSASRMKQWLLLLLCVVMTAGVMVQSAGAAEPTKKCTNLVNEGVEYFSKITVMGSDVSKWRQNLYVYAVHRDAPTTGEGKPNYAGKVVGMDIEVTNDDTRYTCTINNKGTTDKHTEMSCNSIPVNAIINGVYFIYQPDMTAPVDTPITFMVEQVNFADAQPGKGFGLHGTNSKVALPPYPCARNLVTRDFAAAKDKSLVLYSEAGCEGGYTTCTTGFENLQCSTPEKLCTGTKVCESTGISGVCSGTYKCVDLNPDAEIPAGSDGKCASDQVCTGTVDGEGKCSSLKCRPKSDPVETSEFTCYAPSVCQDTLTSGTCGQTSKCLLFTESDPDSTTKTCTSGTTCKDPLIDGKCYSKCIATTQINPIKKCAEFSCSSGELTTVEPPSISAQTLDFYEKYENLKKYAIVNVMHNDFIEGDRIRVKVSPEVDFDYELTFTFGYNYDASTDDYGNKVNVIYKYDPKSTPKGQMDPASLAALTALNLKNENLPLVLLGGNISKVNAKNSLLPDWAGNVPFPTDIDFEIRFWYENETGTLGYENSVFHFIRNMNLQISSTCTETAISPALYDFCQSTRQGFYSTFPTAVTVYDGTAQANKYLYYSTYEKTEETHKFNLGTASSTKSPVSYNTDYNGIIQSKTDPVWDGTAGSWEGRKAEFIFWFMTWKCVDAACDWTTSTSAYPYQLTMSDGGGASRTFTYRGGGPGKSSMTYYVMTPYFDTGRPYAIKGVNFVADEPGTYVIYTFMDYKERNKTAPDPDKYYNKIYVTVNATDELLTCSTLANNGYFQAWWNDCLSPSETQLIRFEHIKGTEEAWVRNRSNHDVSFPFVAEYSYLPQKLEVASLNCYFEQIDGQGNPGAGYCSHYNVFVPAHTKVTITGGTMYMSGYPEYDEYRAAYMREDTMNISHLIFHINVEECKNKKIPDTGLSLRSPMSPLKVNEKVSASADPATGFVFTGNSLRIPAIGLGMETPIPIVHVYYENGTDNMVWDLSTLGNYVGELEGGSYIPYAGNSVLTGHFWSGGVFKNLEGLNYEDEIIIFANDGFKYTYSVVQKFIAQPEEVYEMFQQIGDRSLTLVTCENYNLVTNEYERRYIVRASIKNVEPYVENW